MTTTTPPLPPELDAAGTGSLAPFVSALDAAAVLSVSRSHIYKLLDRGTLAGVRAGNRRLVSWASLEALMTGNDAA